MKVGRDSLKGRRRGSSIVWLFEREEGQHSTGIGIEVVVVVVVVVMVGVGMVKSISILSSLGFTVFVVGVLVGVDWDFGAKKLNMPAPLRGVVGVDAT